MSLLRVPVVYIPLSIAVAEIEKKNCKEALSDMLLSLSLSLSLSLFLQGEDDL